jgi:copper ion binding protein
MTLTSSQHYAVSVPDMSCQHCVGAIRSSVATVPGVEEVDVDLAAKEVRVRGGADQDAIRSAIYDAGFDVVS